MRVILHADFDAFFASVEQLDRPELRGRPVLVGGSPEDRGVVAAASYEARAHGARSAMPMRTALRLCPTSVVRVLPRFDRYSEVSRTVMDLFRARTELVEPLSMDEAYLDLSHALAGAGLGRLTGAGQALKRDVRAAVGLTISVGIGSSKSVAKIASDLDKPDGLVVVPPGEEQTFLAPLAAGRLWGVGPKGEERLRQAGIVTIGDVAAADRRWLEHRFGRWGAILHDLANGVDHRDVSPSRELKSVGRETTFTHDLSDGAQLDAVVARLSEQVARTLASRDLRGRTVTLKLRTSGFRTITRQTRLPTPSAGASVIAAAASRLLLVERPTSAPYRLLGVSVSGFDAVAQLPLPEFDLVDAPPSALP